MAPSFGSQVIRRDIARTYPEHELFKEKDGGGQEALFNVMKAYSVHDREVGYCQGPPFIVGLLLMHMPEEEAFALLLKLMQVEPVPPPRVLPYLMPLSSCRSTGCEISSRRRWLGWGSVISRSRVWWRRSFRSSSVTSHPRAW